MIDAVEPVWADGHQRLISFGRNRSGQYSGELDYSIASYRVQQLSSKEKKELIRLLESVIGSLSEDSAEVSCGTKEDVIESAKDANDHCVDSNEMIEVGDGVQRAIKEDVNA